MSVPDLAVEILRRLTVLDDSWRNDLNFTEWTVAEWFPKKTATLTAGVYVPQPPNAAREAAATKLRTAWTWLAHQGYVVEDHQQKGHWKTITETGWEIGRSTDPHTTLERVKAASQLNLELHPRLRAAGVDTAFRGGDTDSAIRDAFAELEHAVRTLAGYPTTDFGVLMMTKAFEKAGPLGVGVNGQEQKATQRMFEGAFGLFRNPAGHGPTGWGVTEAAEVVLVADLLMRRLDRAASALGKSL